MTFTAEDVVERLADAGVRLDRGLTEADLKRIEKKYAFTFGPDQRALLRAALPLGDAWLNWRHATAANVRERLQRPIESVVLAVHQRGFWPDSWSLRPDSAAAAERRAREELAQAPVLLPLYGGCYLPAAPVPAGGPVFRLAAAGPEPDGAGGAAGPPVALYASDLLAYVDVEFGFDPDRRTVPVNSVSVPFWSSLARGA